MLFSTIIFTSASLSLVFNLAREYRMVPLKLVKEEGKGKRRKGKGKKKE